MRDLKISNSNKIIKIGNFEIGDKTPVFISGPCSVEDFDTMLSLSKKLKKIGVNMLRGGVFKPRTSPYDFQGLQREGLEILKAIKDEVNIPVSTEIMDVRDLEFALDYIDVIQIGSRNMYNYTLLKEVGKVNKPVILKRGISATIKEWIYAGEYIISEGNDNIIFCERGIRTFETTTRNTLDLNAVAYIKEKFNLPVIVDPSHGTGLSEIVERVSLGSIALGADGLIIESHENPKKAISDARQTIDVKTMERIIDKSKLLRELY